jgi:hypothetical protein
MDEGVGLLDRLRSVLSVHTLVSFHVVDQVFATYRLHAASKTGQQTDTERLIDCIQISNAIGIASDADVLAMTLSLGGIASTPGRRVPRYARRKTIGVITIGGALSLCPRWRHTCSRSSLLLHPVSLSAGVRQRDRETGFTAPGCEAGRVSPDSGICRPCGALG